MLDNTLNSNSEEVVHPQNSNNEEVVHPHDELDPDGVLTPEAIDEMEKDEFYDYLYNADPEPDEADGNASDKDVTPDDDKTDPGPDEEKGDVNLSTGNNSTAEPKGTEAKPYRVFNTEDEFNAEINTAFRSRMKKHNDEADRYNRMSEMAKIYYPDAKDPVDTLMQDLESQAAEKNGLSVDEYRGQLDDKRDAELYRKQQKAESEERARQEANQRIVNGWRRDAEQLRVLNSDFNLDDAIKNPQFAKILAEGGTVFEAYNFVHKPNVNKSLERESIPLNGSARNRGTGNRAEVSPASLSSKEFNKFIENCRKG